MTPAVIVLELSRLEAAHLGDLVRQFGELLNDTDTSDPAVARLVPDGYQDPTDASEFRRLTESDLLGRRAADVGTVLDSLDSDTEPLAPADVSDEDATETFVVTLDSDEALAWMRTLSALRLVIATRVGIVDEDDHDPDDPRYGVYEWLGFRLDGLIRALDA
ncbi:DUF2017 family protein [Microbacterium sp.]|uniref:DUF2017 family protein n=1 Tax=Microbacterium sp. TaxID=51671 RepID=UPI003A87D038